MVGFVVGESTSVWQNDSHIARLHGRPNIFPIQELVQQHDSRMLSKAEKYFPALLKQHRMTSEAWWLYGDYDISVSLAPIVGQLVAHELIQQTSVVRFDEYRPTSYFEIIKRISWEFKF